MRLPYSIVNHLADEATDAEIETIIVTLRQLDSQPGFGVSIPFHLPDLRDCYVVWTEDRAWRIVFHRRPGLFFSRRPRIKILAIEREG